MLFHTPGIYNKKHYDNHKVIYVLIGLNCWCFYILMQTLAKLHPNIIICYGLNYKQKTGYVRTWSLLVLLFLLLFIYLLIYLVANESQALKFITKSLDVPV